LRKIRPVIEDARNFLFRSVYRVDDAITESTFGRRFVRPVKRFLNKSYLGHRYRKYSPSVFAFAALGFVVISAGLVYGLDMGNQQVVVDTSSLQSSRQNTKTPAKQPPIAPQGKAQQNPGGTSSSVTPAADGAAPAANTHQFGFSAGDLTELSPAELEKRLTDFNTIGVDWVRFDMAWSNVQQGGPTSYDWSDADRVVAAANAHGLHMLAILDYTPSWARPSGCDDYQCAPADNGKFAAYAAAAVARYKSKGLKDWEIWNEPNHTGAWLPSPSASGYAGLLKASYAAIKQQDSNAVVITGGLAPTYTEDGNIGPADFISSLYKNGARGSFDAVGDHAYSFPALPSLSEDWTGWQQMIQVRSIMQTNGDGSKLVWITEYGAPTNGPGAIGTASNFNFENNPDHVDEALQAQMATQAAQLFKSYNWVGPMFWYGYKDLGTDTGSNEDFFGLLRSDGSKKPAYIAWQQAIQ